MKGFGLFVIVLGVISLLTGMSDGPAKFAMQHLHMMGLGILFIFVGIGIIWIKQQFEEDNK